MISVTSLDKKIASYVEQLNIKQKKVILSVVKAFAEEVPSNDVWDDKDFKEEIDRRTDELESGKVKGYSWEEVKEITRQSLSEIKRK